MPEKKLYRCYIDESGDEGFKFAKNSSPWFLLGGVIVEDSEDQQVRGSIDRILKLAWEDVGQIPPQLLHWKTLDHERKIVAAKEIQ